MPYAAGNYEQIWASTIDILHRGMSGTSVSLWFEEITVALIDKPDVYLVQQFDFKRDIIYKNHLKALTAAMEEALGFKPDIHIYSSERGEVNIAEEVERVKNGSANEDEEKKPLPPPPPKKKPDLYTDTDTIVGEDENIAIPIKSNQYTFDNFIIGSSNRFARAACMAVAENPATNYNPLFIYGASGLGKTHLLWAIINYVSEHNKNANIIYVRGEDFTNQMVSSILHQTTSAFRERYRHADILLIDDIQFIAGKDSTQEEFFHTFNALYEDNKQIIMTSDRPPKDIRTLEDRLKTRFEWGLTADVQPPDYELRIAIMQKKAQLMHIELPIDVAQLLAEHLKSNVRQLEGAIRKLGAQSFLTGAPVTYDLAFNCIADLITGSEPLSVTVERVLEKVSAKYNISVEDIKSRKRTKNIAYARHITAYLIRKLTDMSLPAIGKALNRDHTTIMSSMDTIEAELKNNPSLEKELNEIIKDIKE